MSFAPNSEGGFIDALTTAVHDATNNPTLISISWGANEESWTAAGRAAMESAMSDAATMDVTVCVASGDAGARILKPAALPMWTSRLRLLTLSGAGALDSR